MPPPLVLQHFPVHYQPSVLRRGDGMSQLCRRPWRGPRTRPWDDPSNLRLDTGFIRFADSFDHMRASGPPHHAIDIYGAYGCEIRATVPGVVVREFRVRGEVRPGINLSDPPVPRNGRETNSGNYVMLRDELGYWHHYCHMQRREQFALGQEVRAGQLLGELGATGLLGKHQHLHYQVTRRTSRGVLITAGYVNTYDELRRLAVLLGQRRDLRVDIPRRRAQQIVIAPANLVPWMAYRGESNFQSGCRGHGGGARGWHVPSAPTPPLPE